MPLEPVPLVGRHTRLEPLAEPHREALRAAANHPAIWTYMPLDASGSGFDRWFDLGLEINRRGNELVFAVIDGATGRGLGSTRYMAVELAHKRLEIGHTWYASGAQGGAVNPECKYLLLRHGFERLALNRIELKCDARNARSRAAILKLGASYEGLFRKHMVLRDGTLRDTAWFSIIADDWPAAKAALERRLGGGPG